MRQSQSHEVNEYIDAMKEFGLSSDSKITTESARDLQAFVYQRMAEVSDQLPKGSEISGRVFVVPRTHRAKKHKMRAQFTIKTPDIEFEAIGESFDPYDAVNCAREATIEQLAAVRVALGKMAPSAGKPNRSGSLH